MSPQTALIWNPTKTDRETLEPGVAASAIAAGAELLIVAGGGGTLRAAAKQLADTDDNLTDKTSELASVESLGRALAAREIVPFHITKDNQPAAIRVR